MKKIVIGLVTVLASFLVSLTACAKEKEYIKYEDLSKGQEKSSIVPNKVVSITTIDGKDMKEINIDIENCGLKIEKSKDDKFSFDYVGIKDEKEFDFSYDDSKNGILNVKAVRTILKSSSEKGDMICIDSDNPTNCIRILIPEKEYSNFSITGKKGGSIQIPNIKGKVIVSAESGIVSLKDTILDSNFKFVIDSGILEVSTEKMAASKFEILQDSGITNLNINEILNDVTIKSKNGGKKSGIVNLNIGDRATDYQLDIKGNPIANLPLGWSNNYKTGNGIYKIVMESTGIINVTSGKGIESANSSNTMSFTDYDYNDEVKDFDDYIDQNFDYWKDESIVWDGIDDESTVTGSYTSDGKNEISYNDIIAKLKSEAIPNIVSHIKSISPKSINKIEINADLCGVVVEKSTTGNFELDYIGVKDETQFPLSYEIRSDGTLAITVEVKKEQNELMYINTMAKNRVNVIRVLVPPKAYDSLTIHNATGIVLLPELSIPVIATTINGTIKVKDSNITSNYNLECVNGDVIIEGKIVTGPVTMKTINGDVKLVGDSITGKTTLICHNGDVKLKSDSVNDVVLETINGDIYAEIGTVKGNVDLKADNGDMKIQLLKKPENITFDVSNIGKRADTDFPIGWDKGIKMGNGEPKISISCQNGSAEVSIDE